MRKSGKKAGKSGGEQSFGVMGVAQPFQGTPNLNRHLVGGLSSLLKPSNFQTFAVRKEAWMEKLPNVAFSIRNTCQPDH